MPAFSYKIRDASGRVFTGTVDADNEYSVVSKLRQPGYIVLEISEHKEAIDISKWLDAKKKVSRKDLTIFSRQFATMINAGLPLTKCLSILHEQSVNKKFKDIIDTVQRDIAGGLTLSGALAKHPNVFPDLYVNTVKAGEAGGVLDDVLNKLAEHLEKEDNIRAKIKGAMAYPVLALGFTFVIVIFMIIVIVPIFTKLFADLGGDLPLPTKVLIILSNSIRSFWYLYLGGVISAYFLGKRALKVEEFKSFIDGVKLRFPVVGVLNQKTAVSNFTRTLGTLIVSGVPILGALDIVGETAGNRVISQAIARVRTSVKEGETIAKPLESSKVFPPMVTQMIAVGEETGALDIMLKKVSDFYDNEVEVAVESLTSMIEPILIIVMGVTVAGILLSLYLPMFKLVTLVK